MNRALILINYKKKYIISGDLLWVGADETAAPGSVLTPSLVQFYSSYYSHGIICPEEPSTWSQGAYWVTATNPHKGETGKYQHKKS